MATVYRKEREGKDSANTALYSALFVTDMILGYYESLVSQEERESADKNPRQVIFRTALALGNLLPDIESGKADGRLSMIGIESDIFIVTQAAGLIDKHAPQYPQQNWNKFQFDKRQVPNEG